jgi:hypothetical protein
MLRIESMVRLRTPCTNPFRGCIPERKERRQHRIELIESGMLEGSSFIAGIETNDRGARRRRITVDNAKRFLDDRVAVDLRGSIGSDHELRD